MSENLTVSKVVPAPARRIYEAWLDAEEHALMTGAATSAGDDGAYTAWDGYIEGRTTSAEPYTRIVQTWRASDFPEGHPASTLTVELTEVEGGTEVTLRHEGVPAGMADEYEKGWHEFYFGPMAKYFASPREKLKEGVEALEDAAEKAGEALEDAAEKATEALERAGREVTKALESARKQARQQAVKAVKQTKKVGRQVRKQAKDLGKKVRSLVKGKKAASGKKTPVKKTPVKKAPVAKKASKKSAPPKRPAKASTRATKRKAKKR
ncbi:MAG: SRPBCC domain-containing protein [Myxococcaceae bacterium]|nr:SRPBCC domain-containing protein [Myxococcaceae bacterium]